MVDSQCCVTFCYIAKQISFTRASICCFLDSQCFFQAFFLSSILKVRPLGVAHLKQRLKTYDGCKPGNGSFLAVTPDNLGWIPALCRDCVTSYHRRSYSPVLVSSPSVINDRGENPRNNLGPGQKKHGFKSETSRMLSIYTTLLLRVASWVICKRSLSRGREITKLKCRGESLDRQFIWVHGCWLRS